MKKKKLKRVTIVHPASHRVAASSDDSVAALEVALEEAHHDNKSLSDRVKVLEATLKDMVGQWNNAQLAQRKGNRDKD
jgi:hypothetical protein